MFRDFPSFFNLIFSCPYSFFYACYFMDVVIFVLSIISYIKKDVKFLTMIYIGKMPKVRQVKRELTFSGFDYIIFRMLRI